MTVIALIGSLSLSLVGSAMAHGAATTAEEMPANLAPADGSVLLFEFAARGVQVYACEADTDAAASSFAWTLKAPDAKLLNTRGEVVASHFAGPTWQGSDGSAVVAEVVERADAPEAGAIPWLLLQVQEQTGRGAFSTVTYIQRLHTTGGVAPTEGCDADHVGEEARVPYEATYAFYYPGASASF